MSLAPCYPLSSAINNCFDSPHTPTGKRLLDTKLGSESEFEALIHTANDAGLAYIENHPPQRIIWPKNPDGTPHKFPCVDFFVPTQRLNGDQMQEILRWLATNRPQSDRGRYGYAQYLAQAGPYFARELPHGVLVELVQLLLNQKALLFKKVGLQLLVSMILQITH